MIGPERSRAGHQRLIVAVAVEVADCSSVVNDQPTAFDYQTVARRDVAHGQADSVAPDRADAGDQRQVIAAADIHAQTGVAVDRHPAPVAHDQLVATAKVANIEIVAIGPY